MEFKMGNITNYLISRIIVIFCLGICSIVFPNYVSINGPFGLLVSVVLITVFDLLFAGVLYFISFNLLNRINEINNFLFFFLVIIFFYFIFFNGFTELFLVSYLYSGFDINGIITYLFLGTFLTILNFKFKPVDKE